MGHPRQQAASPHVNFHPCLPATLCDPPPAGPAPQVWLLSTGDSSPRSVTLTVNKNGIWKARDFAALLREVLPPPPALAAAAADDL
jgi:hypothetical protein